MIPVYQQLTIEKDGTGDCFNACVASILELKLEETYDVLPNSPGVWWLNWKKWLKERGYTIELVSRLTVPEGYHIVSTYTERLYPKGHSNEGERISHACVGLNGKIVHDPFEGYMGNYDIQCFYTLTYVVE